MSAKYNYCERLMQQSPVILYIVRSMDGGIGRHIDALAQAATDNREFDTALATSGPIVAPWYKHLWNLDISDSPGISDLKNLWNMAKIVRCLNSKQIIVHGHGAKGGLYARLLKLFFWNKIYVIYTPHGGSLHRIFSKAKAVLYDFTERALVPLTDQFIFESNYSKNVFLKHIKKVSKYAINQNGVNASATPKATIYLPKTPLKLLSFGLYRELKGHDIAISACALLKKEKIPFTYEIFGDGPWKEYLEKLIRDLNLTEEVHLRGYTTSSLMEMRKADIVLHPSRIESFGYVPLEAMSLKIPVVTSFNGGLADYMTDKIGFIAHQNEPEEYYQILKSIYEGTANLQPKTERAFRWLQENMTEEAMKTRALTIYRDCYPPSSRHS